MKEIYEKDALTLKRSLWDRSPKLGGRNEESVRKKGDFYVPPIPTHTPTRFTRMWTSRLINATVWVIVIVHIHGRVEIPFNFT